MSKLSRAVSPAAPTTAAEAERQADQHRAELASTLDRLKSNLQPSNLAHEAFDATRARTPAWIKRSAAVVSSPSGIGLVGAIAASVGATLFKRHRRATRFTRS